MKVLTFDLQYIEQLSPTLLVSDFLFAEDTNLNASTSRVGRIGPSLAQGLTYFFISLPGFLQVFTSLQKLVKRKFSALPGARAAAADFSVTACLLSSGPAPSLG